MTKLNLFELASAILFGVGVLTAVVSIHLDFSALVARLSILISMWCFLSMSWFGRKRIQKQKNTAVLQKTLGIYSYFFFYIMLVVTVIFTFNFMFIR
jgi:hypothetical protein